MPGQLIFDETSLINGNIFKYEQRLHSHVNKYIEGGAILTTYFSQRENSTTVDRGLQDIDQLFGDKSPLRFNKIKNFPLYGFGQANPNNTDEQQIEDITVEGDCVVLPSTITPKPYDFFIINHLKMNAIFEVTAVENDSMKVEGYYKIHYRLHSTSDETNQNLDKQTVEKYDTDLNAIGSNLNPIIQEDEFLLRGKVEKMVNKMIESYIAMYYNERHNCFIYHDPKTGLDIFDMCANQFMYKYSLVNIPNSNKMIILNSKLCDIQFQLFYNNSIFNWLELGAPARLLQKFYYQYNISGSYITSSFYLWGETDVQIIQPLSPNQTGIMNQDYSYFNEKQLEAFLNPNEEPKNIFDQLIWKYIHKADSFNVKDISLYTADMLLNSIDIYEVYLYTPILIYIIREALGLN